MKEMNLNRSWGMDLLLFELQLGQVDYVPTPKGRVEVLYLATPKMVPWLDLEFRKKKAIHTLAVRALTSLSFAKNNLLAIGTQLGTNPKKSRKEILWNLGRNPRHYSSFFYDRLCRVNHEVKLFAASWRALELFYNYPDQVKPRLNGDLNGFLGRCFMGDLENRQSVTNRYKIVSHILSRVIPSAGNGNGIRILSIASGAAQALIETLKKFPDLEARVTLLDLDETALDQARKMADHSGLGNRLVCIKGGPNKLRTLCRDSKPDVIEMIGFLDYRPRDKAISLIRHIYDSLPAGGLFLTCNIRKNPEKAFLDWVVLWPMIYREERELAEVLVAGGFAPEKVNLIYEPFRIHGVAVCRK